MRIHRQIQFYVAAWLCCSGTHAVTFKGFTAANQPTVVSRHSACGPLQRFTACKQLPLNADLNCLHNSDDPRNCQRRFSHMILSLVHISRGTVLKQLNPVSLRSDRSRNSVLRDFRNDPHITTAISALSSCNTLLSCCSNLQPYDFPDLVVEHLMDFPFEDKALMIQFVPGSQQVITVQKTGRLRLYPNINADSANFQVLLDINAMVWSFGDHGESASV